MKTILTMLLMILSAALAAQNPNIIWSKVYGGNSTDDGVKLIPLSNGELIGIGNSQSTDSLLDCNNGAFDGTIFKLDSNGNVINKLCFGGTSDDFITDGFMYSDTEIFICGYTTSTNGIFNGNHGQHDGFLCKLDTNFNIIWERTYGSSNWDMFYKMIKLSNGNIAILGAPGTNDFDLQNVTQQGGDGFWLLIVDENGSIFSNQIFGGASGGLGYSLDQLESSEIVVTGLSIDSFNQYHLFLSKLNMNGVLIWKKEYGSGGISGAFSACSDPQLNIYVIANGTNDPMIWDNHGSTDCAVLKFDSSGNEIWGRCFGGSDYDFGVNIFYKNNHLFICGSTQSNDGNIALNIGLTDAWLFEISTDAIIENSQTFGGWMHDAAENLISMNDSSFAFIGTSESGDHDVHNPSALVPGNIWVCKIKKEALGINWSDHNSNIKVFPNPSNGSFTVSGLPETSKSITISNILGQVIYSDLNTNEKTIEINLPDIETGIYFLKIISQELNFTEKIMKL